MSHWSRSPCLPGSSQIEIDTILLQATTMKRRQTYRCTRILIIVAIKYMVQPTVYMQVLGTYNEVN